MRLSDAVGSEDPAVLCEKAAALVSLLQRHDRNEELGLYRETERAAPEYVANLLREHREIDRLITSSPRTSEGVAALMNGIDKLRKHIFVEEQDLFPYAFQTLSVAQWDVVEAVHAAARSSRDGGGLS